MKKKQMDCSLKAFRNAPEHSSVAFRLPFDGAGLKAEQTYFSEKNDKYPCFGLTVVNAERRIGSGNQHLSTLIEAIKASEPVEGFVDENEATNRVSFDWDKVTIDVEDKLIVGIHAVDVVKTEEDE